MKVKKRTEGQNSVLCNTFLFYGSPSIIPWPLGVLVYCSSHQVNLGTRNLYFSKMKVKTRSEGQNSAQSFSRPRVVPCVLLLWFNGISANAKSIFFVVLQRPGFCWLSLEIDFQSLPDFHWCLESKIVFYGSVLLPLWNHDVLWKSKICFVRRRAGWVWLASALSVQSADALKIQLWCTRIRGRNIQTLECPLSL